MLIRFSQRDGAESDAQEIKSMRLVREGPELNVWVDDSGREHFFDKEGYYDGWGEPFRSGGEGSS
jgi:hypothetical protein